MKPPPFVYDRAGSVAEAVDLLAEHGDGARVLAGGQSLVPMLNLRVARPERLVDVGGIGELERLGTGNGQLIIGALVRHQTLEAHPAVRDAIPVLSHAAAHIGHPAIRRRGTIGGSVAHADPSAELIAVGSAMGASVTLDSRRGRRTVEMADLVVGPYETVVAADELLTWLSFPLPAAGSPTGFYEIAPRHGDFATVGAVWHERVGGARVSVFGADVGHLVVEVPPGSDPDAVVDRVRDQRRMSDLATHRLAVAVARAAEDAHVRSR